MIRSTDKSAQFRANFDRCGAAPLPPKPHYIEVEQDFNATTSTGPPPEIPIARTFQRSDLGMRAVGRGEVAAAAPTR